MPPLARNQQHEAERRDQPVDHRVFREQPEPGGDPDRDPPRRDPPARPIRIARPDEGVERRRPARQQRGVGRDDVSGQRHAGRRQIGERRPEPDPAVIEPRSDRIDEPGRDGVQQRGRQADRELAVAECAGRQRDQPGDQRRLRVVAEAPGAAPRTSIAPRPDTDRPAAPRARPAAPPLSVAIRGKRQQRV